MRHGSIYRETCKVLLALTLLAGAADGEQQWAVSNATFTLNIHSKIAGSLAVRTTSARTARESGLSSAEFLVIDGQILSIAGVESGVGLPKTQVVRLVEGIVLSTGHSSVTVTELVVFSEQEVNAVASSTPAGVGRLELRGVRAKVDQSSGELMVPVLAVTVSAELAASLGDSDLSGVSIGSGVVRGSAVWVGGDALAPMVAPVSPVNVAASTLPAAPDVTFCELFGLTQFGRKNDVVGLAINTTSWNIGNADLTWLAAPDPRHPFIVQNLYRIKDDRFEQIGQSWIKHGFFALGNEQCQTECTFEDKPGHGVGPFLGMGCTDTYTAGLNALQRGLGPRQEVNPWTAAWDSSTSELNTFHNHDTIKHRLQVRDADLNPGQNLFSRYIVEGYYVHFEDVLPLNNAAWKEITSITGLAGGTWTFSMPPLGVDMAIGFAVDAWEGAEQTILAEQIPVEKGVSPDGRCDLRAKATDNGDGTWHYEYAILNIDMNRKARSFTVPIDPSNSITNIGFHAVKSHDESFTNDRWSNAILSDCPVGDRCIKWETVNNPLRWGTVYNFRFDASAPPLPGPQGDARGATVVLGLFEPGEVMSVSGPSLGPANGSLIPVAAMETPVPDAVGSQFPKSRFISFLVPPTDVGIDTALRVELTSLHHPQFPEDAPDFSAFEGQLRYVNLFRDPATGEPITDCLDSGAQGTTFKCAGLGCEPEYADWAMLFAGEVLHVSGAATVPSSTFHVVTLAFVCEGQEATCASVSDPLAIDTGVWGNVNDNPLLNISDVTAIVDSVKAIPGAPIESRSLLRGNVPNPVGSTQNIFDVTLAVDALKGFPFPFLGPQICP